MTDEVEQVDLLAALQRSIDRHKASAARPHFAQGGVIRPSEGEDSGPRDSNDAQGESAACRPHTDWCADCGEWCGEDYPCFGCQFGTPQEGQ